MEYRSCDNHVTCWLINLQEVDNESEDVISANESGIVDQGSNVLLRTEEVGGGERERERERERE